MHSANSRNFFCNTPFDTRCAPDSNSSGPMRNERNSENNPCKTDENSGRLAACDNRPNSAPFRFITRLSNMVLPN